MSTLQTIALLLTENVKFFGVMLVDLDGFRGLEFDLVHSLSGTFMRVPIKDRVLNGKELLLLLDLDGLGEDLESRFQAITNAIDHVT
jgi:hypothetical protein